MFNAMSLHRRLALTVLVALLGVVTGIALLTKASRVGCYWAAIIATHPLGAALGDFMTKDDGLNLGNARSSAILAGVLAVALRSVAALHAEQGLFDVEGFQVDRVVEKVHVEIGGEIHAEWKLPKFSSLVAVRRVLRIDLPYTPAELADITTELVRRNGYRQDVYIRPLAFKSQEVIGVRLHDIRDEFSIFVMAYEKYVKNDTDAHVTFSSWRRVDDNMIPARGKVAGAYANSALIKTDAVQAGFDEALVLDGIDLEIARGERVAVVGASGGGKSTLAALLTGLRVPESGLLLLDGLRRHVARRRLGAVHGRGRHGVLDTHAMHAKTHAHTHARKQTTAK